MYEFSYNKQLLIYFVEFQLKKQQIDDIDPKVFDHLSNKISSYHISFKSNTKECISVPEVVSFSNFWMEIKVCFCYIF